MKTVWEALVRFDEWLIDKCQRFSDWLTLKFGIGKANYKMANLCLTIYVVGAVFVSFINNFSFNFLSFFEIFLMLGFGLILRHRIEKAQKKEESAELSNPEIARKNPFLENARYERIINFLIFLVLSIVYVSVKTLDAKKEYWTCIVYVFCLQMFPLYVYFLSCSSLPPGKSKVLEWLTMRFGKKALAEAKGDAGC